MRESAEKYIRLEQNMYSKGANNPIFSYIAQNLRSELTKITSNIEYAQLSGDVSLLDDSKYSSQYMLRLIECYLDFLDQTNISQNVEPVSLSALLKNVASSMAPYAKWQQCDLDLNVAGRYQPVMANREVLNTVLTSLSSVFIVAQSEVKHKARPVITYAVTRSNKGITAGIYSNVEAINSAMLKKARNLYGKSGNPMSASVSNGSAGLYMADSLLNNMSYGLRVSKFHKMTGLSASFEPSKQIALV
ncbi:hypothetical protein KC946_00810 [Candidatus Saccharibacteria bacterium]|nr:hypothetical protein [Candidatus Saccharibacteria bacterium]